MDKEVAELLAKAGTAAFDVVFRVLEKVELTLCDQPELLCLGSIWRGPGAVLYVLKPGLYGAWGLYPDAIGPQDKHLIGIEPTNIQYLELGELFALEEHGYLEFVQKPRAS